MIKNHDYGSTIDIEWFSSKNMTLLYLKLYGSHTLLYPAKEPYKSFSNARLELIECYEIADINVNVLV